MNYNPKVVSFDRSSAYVHHRAMVNRRENNPVDALELMRHAIESSPDNQEYQLDLAELYCEMGLHEQSSHLILDMLAQKNAPAECFYGLALNQLGMNDLEGARRSLQRYRQMQPEGDRSLDIDRLFSELDLCEALNRPIDRKLFRAMRVADSACTALQNGDLDRAKRLFERSLSLSSEQYEMRAMYAMTLMMRGEDEQALAEAERASEGFPPSLRAMCVASQVFAALEKTQRARELLLKVMKEKPQGVEMRLLIFSLGELDMHAEIEECARLALQETPYDRQLLHVRAVAKHNLGEADSYVARFWHRILRIDPDDNVAQFYYGVCMRGELAKNSPDYSYQVPEAEASRRTLWLSKQFSDGLSGAQKRWSEDAEFRQTILWATQTDDEKLRKVAVTVIAAMEDEKAQSSMRALMFGRELQRDLKNHAAMLLRLRGANMNEIFPVEQECEGNILPETEEIMRELLVGERQLIRYANEMLEEKFGMSAMAELAAMWVVYRQRRGLFTDPLTNSEAASAALIYNYLLRHKMNASVDELTELFGCSRRRLVYYASRIADRLEQTKGEHFE